MKTYNGTDLNSIEAVKQFFLNQRENVSIPNALLEYAKSREGKPLTSRDLEPLHKATGQRWYIVKHYGWTCLQTRARVFSSQAQLEPHELPFDIMLQRSEVNVVWNSAWIYENNAHSYSAAKARNDKREKAASDQKFLEAVFTASKAALAARKQLEAQADRLKELCAYGEPGEPDEYEIQRLAGVYHLDKLKEA